jgi:hypothetical protein
MEYRQKTPVFRSKRKNNKPFWKEKQPTMFRIIAALSIGIFVVLMAQDSSRAQGTVDSKAKAQTTQYEVLSPWADADPVPFRGISPRIETLSGKKIGLFVNPKRAALPIAESIQRRLVDMYPDAEIIMYRSYGANVNEIETDNKEAFTSWAKSLDAAIAVVGD